MSEISSSSNCSGSMTSKDELKQLSECQFLEMFDEASHNVFNLAKKYHDEGYDITFKKNRPNISYDARNNSGKTVTNPFKQNLLHYACQHKNYDIIKFLIEFGVDVNSDSTLIAYLFNYITSPFPESTPISEQIETDNLVLNLFMKNLDFSDEYAIYHLDFIEHYLNTKSINHQISTVSLLITILKKYCEIWSDVNYDEKFNKFLLTAINCNCRKDIIVLLLPHCNFENSSYYSDELLSIVYMADKLIPVSEVSSGKLTHGMRVVIMDGEVEHSILIVDHNLQPKHIEVIIRQFETRKSYLSIHTLTLSKTQQINMISAAMEGDFSVALEFDKEGYDIITSSNSIYFHIGYNVIFYACLHNRLDLMQEFIDKGVFLFFMRCNRSILSEYIIHTTKFNPEVATFLIDNGIDIHYTNPILQYYDYREYTLLPDDMVVYFKQQGFSFQKCQLSDLNEIFRSPHLLYFELTNTKTFFLKEPFFLQLRDLGADLSIGNSYFLLQYLFKNHFDIMDHDVFKYNIDCLIRLGITSDTDYPYVGAHTHISHPTVEPLFIKYITMFKRKHVLDNTQLSVSLLVLEMMYSDVQYLVSCGFNVNGVLNGKSVLFHYFDTLIPYLNHSVPTFNIAKAILKTLVNSKADINYQNIDGMNLLMHYLTIPVVEDYNPHIVHMLIEFGFDLNSPIGTGSAEHSSPLLYIIKCKTSDELVYFLMGTEISLDIIQTIINHMMVLIHNGLIQPYLSTGKMFARILRLIFHKLQLCIDYSMMYSYEDYLNFAIFGSIEVKHISKLENETLLYYYRLIMQMLTGTTKKQHQVRRLKKHLIRHNRSLNPLTSITSVRSCVSEDYSVVKMLHERYYNTVLVLHPVDHTSVLMYAAKHGFVPMVRWAIRLGANVNAVDRKGMTALMYCCKYSQKYEVIELLLWHGADVGVKWKRKYTAFDMLYMY